VVARAVRKYLLNLAPSGIEDAARRVANRVNSADATIREVVAVRRDFAGFVGALLPPSEATGYGRTCSLRCARARPPNTCSQVAQWAPGTPGLTRVRSNVFETHAQLTARVWGYRRGVARSRRFLRCVYRECLPAPTRHWRESRGVAQPRCRAFDFAYGAPLHRVPHPVSAQQVSRAPRAAQPSRHAP
jgi:hypothetical protein